jgi:hypothetical protein
MDEFKSDQEIFDMGLDAWVGEIIRLWQAIDKPVDRERLGIYISALQEIPFGILHLAISRALRAHTYSNVPTIGEVFAAVKQELGNPRDVKQAISEWIQARPTGILRTSDGRAWVKVEREATA